jgi:hypothetical protein
LVHQGVKTSLPIVTVVGGDRDRCYIYNVTPVVERPSIIIAVPDFLIPVVQFLRIPMIKP